MPKRMFRRVRKNRLRRRRIGRGRALGRRYRRPTVYNFKRTKFYQNIVSVGTALPYSQHWGFRLSDLPDASDFTALYDEYQITKAVIKFIPKFSQVNVTTGVGSITNSVLTQMMSAIDYDDSNSLPTATAIDQITQYQSLRMTRGNVPHTRVISPKVELTANAISNIAPKWRQWLDCDNTTILHNGLKVVIPAIPGLDAGTVLYWDAMVTVYLKFRNVL